ncbi:phosphotransferase family enzyme [Tumebacillus sp. BK434]|uniref:phosphotransferase family protein n=1 Tax=Tumebacillus sp. BK434 TaxID=2512169 RepID=UPI00104D0EB2|nr:aminoglycoside phosphotransferase family protein [Tumebacillus sp. BK434]TCP58182.1 phosphotransferase family enzyme [Tumebacillus sp. BK434]
MLNRQTSIQHLLTHRLLEEQQIVNGNLSVLDVTRRNLNFQVISTQGRSYLLKAGKSAEEQKLTAQEASAYRYFQQGAGQGSGMVKYLPRFYRYDQQDGILVIELLRGATSLHDYFYRKKGRFPVHLARQAGDALGRLHLCNSGLESFPSSEPPWILRLHRPAQSIYHGISSANLRLVKIMQRFPAFCEALELLHREWTTDVLIHHDVKWDNFLVVPDDTDSNKRPGLRLIDWELAALGDACWDVGSMFNTFLSAWLHSIPITGDTPPERALQLAKHPIHTMHPALRAFWQAYCNRTGLTGAERDRKLIRSVRYAAARLVLAAYEAMQSSIEPTGNMICFLQMSANILQRPELAAVQVLGIPLKAGEM